MEFERYKMIYKIEKGKNDEKNLRLLNGYFIKNNENKSKLIIKNKKYKIKEFIKINYFEEERITIGIILNINIYNRNYLFKDCK